MRASDLSPLAIARLRAWAIWLALLALAVSLYRCGSAAEDAPGVAQPHEHRVATTEMGRLLSVDVHEGQSVRRGQRLARLDTRDVDAQIALARAELERAKVNMPATGTQLAQDGFETRRTLQTEVEQSQLDLATLKSTADQQRAELQALERNLSAEQAALRQGLVRDDRARELQLRHAALAPSVNHIAARLQAAQQHVNTARQRLADWDRHFALRGNASSPSPQDARLQPLAVDLQERRTQLAQLEQKRLQSDIVATVDGVIQSIQVRSGDVVRPGDPMITMVENTATQVVAYVAERSGVRIEPGAQVAARRRVALSTAPLGQQIGGVVTGVSGAIALIPNRFWPNPQVPVYGREVYIRLDQASAFSPGESIDVRFGGTVPPSTRATDTAARPSHGTEDKP